MGKMLIGLTGWIRDINNSWAEQFDLRRPGNGEMALVALGSLEKNHVHLITEAEAEEAFEKKGLCEYGDKELRGVLVLQIALNNLSRALMYNDHIRLDFLLEEAVRSYCRMVAPGDLLDKGRTVEPYQDIA